jgi:hypothetical protein
MRKEREDAELSRKSRLRTFGLHGWLVMPHFRIAADSVLSGSFGVVIAPVPTVALSAREAVEKLIYGEIS